MSQRLLGLAMVIAALFLASSAQAATWVAHSLVFPSGISQEKLFGIGCPSPTTSCTAVGQDYNGIWGAHGESGSYATWAAQPVVRSPGSSAWPNAVLNGSSCTDTSPTWCMTVGAQGTSGGTPASMAELQTTTWRFFNTGVPGGATRSAFNAVDCDALAHWCMAVGYKMVRGDDKPFAMIYSGGTWTDAGAPSASNATYKGVSCPAANYCVAVGGTAGNPLATIYSSGTWFPTTPVVPSGGANYLFNGISCVNAVDCVAVGQYSTGGTIRGMSSVLSNTTWGSAATLVPTAATSMIAYGVSCVAHVRCTAVGTNAGQPFSDFWNGSAWSALAISVPAGATGGELRGISCDRTYPPLCHASGWSLFGGTPTGLIETYS
jgi:hypothetical protein